MEFVDLLVKDETKNNPSLNLGKLNLLLNLYYPWLLSNVKGLTKYVNVNVNSLPYTDNGEGNAAFVNTAAPAISKPGLAYVEVDKVKRKNKSKNERLYKMAAAIQRNKYTSNLIKAHKYSTLACLNLNPNDLILRK